MNLALLSIISTTTLALSQTGGGRWHSDLKTAAAVAAKTGKPIFVVFRCER